MRFSLVAGAAAIALSAASGAAPILAAPAATLGSEVQPFVRIPAGRLALTHVRVIDGTGAPAVDDQTILFDGPRIVAVQPGSAPVPATAAGMSAFDPFQPLAERTTFSVTEWGDR